MGFGETWLLDRLILLVPVVMSLSVHEWAHAASAALLGDRTAASQGRLTLNPLEHMDPVGTLLLPLIGIPFGWAKPVPVDPSRFRSGISMGTGLALTAAAGPMSNLALAAGAGGLLALLPPALASGGAAPFVLLQTLVVVNLLLAFFNLLPIPPLDGSRMVDAWVPVAWRPAWDAFAAVGPVCLVAVVVVPLFAGVSLLSWPLETSQRFLALVTGP